MPITVKTGAALRALFGGQRETRVEGQTVGELLDMLKVKDRLCDGNGKVRRHFSIHVNEGEDIRLLDGLDTPVHEGDVVTILSVIAGGQEEVQGLMSYSNAEGCTGRTDTARKVWLTFPNELIERPLIWEVGQKFRVVTNIRQASVSRDLGLVGLELSGEQDEVNDAIEFLTDAGVTVEPIELDVVE